MMKRILQSKAEMLLAGVGLLLPLLLIGLYVWGAANLASKLSKAAGAGRSEPVPSVEFNIKAAQTILQKRGLLQ